MGALSLGGWVPQPPRRPLDPPPPFKRTVPHPPKSSRRGFAVSEAGCRACPASTPRIALTGTVGAFRPAGLWQASDEAPVAPFAMCHGAGALWAAAGPNPGP